MTVEADDLVANGSIPAIPPFKLMLTILGGVATWEREIMLERQREGIPMRRAKANTAASANLPAVS